MNDTIVTNSNILETTDYYYPNPLLDVQQETAATLNSSNCVSLLARNIPTDAKVDFPLGDIHSATKDDKQDNALNSKPLQRDSYPNAATKSTAFLTLEPVSKSNFFELIKNMLRKKEKSRIVISGPVPGSFLHVNSQGTLMDTKVYID